MEPDLAASVADRDDAATGAAGDVVPGFDTQKQAGPRHTGNGLPRGASLRPP
jgi:hypothetical protein